MYRIIRFSERFIYLHQWIVITRRIMDDFKVTRVSADRHQLKFKDSTILFFQSCFNVVIFLILFYLSLDTVTPLFRGLREQPR